MIYLIGLLAFWLLLTAAFMALAGWAYAADRAAPDEDALHRERDQLLQDIVRSSDGAPAEVVLEDDASTRLLSIRDARIAELERSLETARSHGDGLSAELADLQRRGRLDDVQVAELARLRQAEAERARTVDVEAEPVEDENAALQAWRLRYFEQRVQYLEKQSREKAVPAPPVVEQVTDHSHEWAAREANARAAYLENELRALREAPAPQPEAEPEEVEPFAANAEIDMLLRWRMLYLERRVAHLQAQADAEPEAPAPLPPPVLPEPGPDPDRWKWRARYLEARVRHLETRPMAPVAAPVVVAEEPEPTPPPAPVGRRAKPPVLSSARNGAPDDLTLIEGVSLLQQTTLYSLGVFHFDQIAAWTDENVAWVDQYLRLQGRIDSEEWREQADDLAREGPAAARRVMAEEDV